MNWYYVENGQQTGPVTDEQLEELRRGGRITDETLVWREGMANWVPCREARPPGTAATGAAPPLAAGILCAECGKAFTPDQVIRVQDRYVCAACKPVYLQRIREGLTNTGSTRARGTVTIEELLARDYEHDLGGYLSQAWQVFKGNAGMIIGASALVYLCMMVINIIPYLNWLLTLIFGGPLMGGLWLFYLKNVRGEGSGIGDAFSGFGPRFGHLLLAHLIPGLLMWVCIIPVGVVVGVGVLMFGQAGRGASPLDSGMGIALISMGVLFGIAGICGMVYLSTCWMFALPLVADKGMGFWSAMGLSRKVVIKHWWMTWLVVFVIGLVGFVGVFACVVGLLVSAPVAFAALSCAYDKLFGDLAPRSA